MVRAVNPIITDKRLELGCHVMLATGRVHDILRSQYNLAMQCIGIQNKHLSSQTRECVFRRVFYRHNRLLETAYLEQFCALVLNPLREDEVVEILSGATERVVRTGELYEKYYGQYWASIDVIEHAVRSRGLNRMNKWIGEIQNSFKIMGIMYEKNTETIGR